MKLERTHSAEAVLRVVGHEEMLEDLWEDTPTATMHDSIYHLLVKEERFGDGAVYDQVIGVVSFVPLNRATWNPHIAILPPHRGKGTEALRQAVRWMFENTPCRKLFAMPPVFKPAMIRVFQKCEFSHEGLSTKSFPWKGQMHDRVLMGLEKEQR